MPAPNTLSKMTFYNGREMFGAPKVNNNNKKPSNSVVKMGIDLNNAMIGRIKDVRPGCGACGK
jgi:hypothetical protein